MRCEEVMEGLDDWLDQALDARLRANVDVHLASCESCRREFARHRALADDLHVLGRIADRIVDAPAHSGSWRARWTRIGRVAAILAIAVGAALVGWNRMNHGAAARFVEKGSIAGPIEPIPDSHKRLARFEFEPSEPNRHMVVSVESDNPRVHIVWLYENTLGKPAQPSSRGAETDLHKL